MYSFGNINFFPDFPQGIHFFPGDLFQSRAVHSKGAMAQSGSCPDDTFPLYFPLHLQLSWRMPHALPQELLRYSAEAGKRHYFVFSYVLQISASPP